MSMPKSHDNVGLVPLASIVDMEQCLQGSEGQYGSEAKRQGSPYNKLCELLVGLAIETRSQRERRGQESVDAINLPSIDSR